MFAYRGVRAMLLLGLKFANINFTLFGGNDFQHFPFSLSSVM